MSSSALDSGDSSPSTSNGKKFEPDFLDIAIFGSLSDRDGHTVMEVVRRLMEAGSPVEDMFEGDNRSEIKKWHGRIGRRMQKMVDFGLLDCLAGSRQTRFFLNKAAVLFGDGDLHFLPDDQDEIVISLGRIILLRDADGVYTPVQI